MYMPRPEALARPRPQEAAPASVKKPGVEANGTHMTIMKGARKAEGTPVITLTPQRESILKAQLPDKMTLLSRDLTVQSFKMRDIQDGGNPHTKGSPDDSCPTEACIEPMATSPGDPACSMPEVPCSRVQVKDVKVKVAGPRGAK